MLHTVEALIDAQGNVQWLEHVQLLVPQRVLITLLDPAADDTVLLAEPALVKDWLNDEEEAAWALLQPGS